MLTESRLRRLVRSAADGRRSAASVARELASLPVDRLAFANLDTHRCLRRGAPEAVFGTGKTPAQLIAIARRFIAARELLLITRLDPEAAQLVQAAVPALRYHPTARLGYWHPGARLRLRGLVAVATGGTADIPVADEAALTLELLGSRAARLDDVGVAGLHRVLGSMPLLRRARAVVVVAGMEGALPSVVAGLVRAPVIAVPTSIGYGAHLGGVGPLLTMLSSCAPGIGVVNIDNGFGAGYLAGMIVRRK